MLQARPVGWPLTRHERAHGREGEVLKRSAPEELPEVRQLNGLDHMEIYGILDHTLRLDRGSQRALGRLKLRSEVIFATLHSRGSIPQLIQIHVAIHVVFQWAWPFSQAAGQANDANSVAQRI